ncbi:TPA: hypothetical protein U0919_002245, partial [Streptococcus suis]|nr:hypothetical protein [Streptococcus suis]
NNVWTKKGNLKGATGATGATGKTGATGAAGTSMRSGTTVPANTLGINGDTYINTTNGDLYTKANNVWTKKGNLKGATGATGATGKTGATGAAGTSMRSGTTVPANTLGINGDTYINTANGDLYTKANNVWTKQGNLKGATGATGAKGATGATGAAGTSMRSGTTVPANTLGINGDTYINTTNGDLYTKA